MSHTKDSEIIVYSTTWCGYCHQLKSYLDQKDIKYTDKDIEKDPEAYQELQAKMGGQFRGVPVADIDGRVILGFDRPAIEEALRSHNA